MNDDRRTNMRINRFLAQSGVDSRRKVEELIKQGKVKLNSEVIRDLATTVDPKKDTVTYDGKIIKLPEEKIYIMLNKPKGYVTTAVDTHDRPTVFDLLSGFNEKMRMEGKKVPRLFTVGRLDMNSRGLLLLTNDGDWAYKFTHPKHTINKTYKAALNGNPSDEQIDKLRHGVDIDGYITKPAEVKKIKANKFVITISEGKKRQVRLMFRSIGFQVKDLKRTIVGKYELGDLKSGEYKEVKP
jgi:23S rRNA pseudouridine2605 synthase